MLLLNAFGEHIHYSECQIRRLTPNSSDVSATAQREMFAVTGPLDKCGLETPFITVSSEFVFQRRLRLENGVHKVNSRRWLTAFVALYDWCDLKIDFVGYRDWPLGIASVCIQSAAVEFLRRIPVGIILAIADIKTDMCLGVWGTDSWDTSFVYAH